MISNASRLTGNGMVGPRELALAVAAAGLEACDPGAATEEAVGFDGATITIGGRELRPGDGSRVIVLGAGKATLPIATTLERTLGDRIDAGAIAVREDEADVSLARIEVLAADHPLPSRRSIEAGRRLMELAASARRGDLVLAAFTGGSSALACLPPDGVSANDKRQLHEVLLRSGAPIAEVNTVRKHISQIKGGRLAATAAPAQLVNLTVSDVAGDALDVFTGPTVQDTTTPADAEAVLERWNLTGLVPESVLAQLRTPAAESPRLEREPRTVVLVSGARACEAMGGAAKSHGAAAHVVALDLEGEAADVGRDLGRLAARTMAGEGPVSPPCVLVGCGGEATVRLGERVALGAGGPNQEVAIAAALELPPGAPIAGCFLDTDGSDGGGEVAGALIDGATAQRATERGLDLAGALAAHRSGEALAALGDRLVTGPTGTNVNDLFVLAVFA